MGAGAQEPRQRGNGREGRKGHEWEAAMDRCLGELGRGQVYGHRRPGLWSQPVVSSRGAVIGFTGCNHCGKKAGLEVMEVPRGSGYSVVLAGSEVMEVPQGIG